MTTPTIVVGTRVHWKGDLSNAPRSGKVESIEGAMIYVAWDGGAGRAYLPIALLSTPRWQVLS